ncbi:hypothetical protein CXB51_002997 [Gossypium anomalum]|uniref:Uncharacterized protein n=1 Tax=Gossypium anomalum TaxID=47600 RepID=A0A8J6D9P7_9ROSI|nr:hypothetical protein CXB51_002997 [Gossypium anomalum]
MLQYLDPTLLSASPQVPTLETTLGFLPQHNFFLFFLIFFVLCIYIYIYIYISTLMELLKLKG